MSDFRKGVCQDCNAEFNIPADFPHDRARCRQCKTGTVVIEPAAGAAPKAPKPVPAATPPKAKPADGMTMKEKILARKKAEAEAAAKAGTPAAKPAAPAKPAPAAKRATPTEAKDDAKPARATRGSRAGAKKSSWRSSARGARGKRGDADEGEGRGRGRATKEKKSPMIPIIAVVVLVLGGGAGWYFTKGPGAKEEPKTTDVANNATAKTPEPEITPAEPMEDTGAETTDKPMDAAAATPADKTAADKPKDEPKAEKTYDPSEITYDEFELFGPAIGTTDEEWADIQKQVEQMVDMSGGAKQSRARKKLEDYGYKSLPAVLNQARQIDMGSEDAYVLGDMFNNMMVNYLNGRNANWNYSREEDGLLTKKAQYVNRQVVRIYLGTWNEVVKDPTAWVGAAKLNDAKFRDQLLAYAAAIVEAGITEGEYIDDLLDAYEAQGSGGGDDGDGSDDDDKDDLDDF